MEGLNRKDETAPGADRSGYVDSWFAKLANDVGAPLAGATIASGATSGSAPNVITTYTTSLTHGLFVGQTVCITGTDNTTHNVAFVQVRSVPSLTTFTVLNASSSSTSTGGTVFIPGVLYYNNHTYDDQVVDYSPPIARLQRLHITLRRHLPPASVGTTTPLGAPITFGASQNSFTFDTFVTLGKTMGRRN